MLPSGFGGGFMVETKSFPGCDQSATTTDCSKLTPAGTPYTPPIKEESTVTTLIEGKIDGHLTVDNKLRDVDFCGKIYRVKQVVIDGVDVVQRVAELARDQDTTKNPKIKNFAEGICGSIPFNPQPQDELGINNIVINTLHEPDGKIGAKTGSYGIYTQFFQVEANTVTNEISSINGFDGSVEFVGKLKK